MEVRSRVWPPILVRLPWNDFFLFLFFYFWRQNEVLPRIVLQVLPVRRWHHYATPLLLYSSYVVVLRVSCSPLSLSSSFLRSSFQRKKCRLLRTFPSRVPSPPLPRPPWTRRARSSWSCRSRWTRIPPWAESQPVFNPILYTAAAAPLSLCGDLHIDPWPISWTF